MSFVAHCVTNCDMPNRTTMNVSLPEPMRAWVESRVETGDYANASDYVRDLIRHDQVQHRDAVDDDAMAAIRQGVADLKAGRTKPAEEVFSRLEARFRAP